MNGQQIVSAQNFDTKPIWLKGINAAWRGSYFLGTEVALDKDSLIKQARKESGLHSFGEDFWEEPLERLIASVNEEARLHPFGRFITQKRLINLLAVRLRAEHWFKKHPEILEQDLYPVTVICGLQRTGTTKLHRLLSADPDNRLVMSWEALNPAPLTNDKAETGKRKAAARMSEKALKLIAPGFFSIHPVEYEKPEEDILLLDTTFLSTTAEATMHVPTYASWLEQTDQSRAYEYAVKLLKLLQWQRPAKRWILKTPHHMEFLGAVKKHFGDVHYIWTHRDIAESLPSFLSMVAHGRAIFSDEVSADEVAKHWVRKTAYMLSKGLEFRKTNPDARFTDLFYKDIVASPMKQLEVIYQLDNNYISEELHNKFLATENENTIHRFGKHIYKLEDFHLTRDEVDKEMGLYQDFMKTLMP